VADLLIEDRGVEGGQGMNGIVLRGSLLESCPMGFLPFVNQGGQRIVRWHRLILVWIAGISATMFGSCTMGYILTGDWRYGAFIGMAMGVAFSTVVTIQGYNIPIDKLPPIQPRSSSAVRNA